MVTTTEQVEWDYQWITGPDGDPDDSCALVSPRRAIETKASKRRKKNQRVRKPVVAVEPAPNRMALKVPEAAWLLNCSPNMVWGLVGSGELASFTLGRKRLVARDVVAAFIERGSTDDGMA